jgi:DHA2 family multidrug resistance protein-like MFS transporter
MPAEPKSLATRSVFAACYLAMLSVGDNSTAIMAALPTMRSDLQLGPTIIEWIVNAYLLAAAVFIILGGDAADRFGARTSSTIGVVLFALASLLIAVAPDGVVVIGARALQGLGAALAVAGTLAAVTEASAPSERAGAIGGWTAFLMLGFSIGPLVGGLVTHYLGWRFNFWLNVVIMVPAAFILAVHRDSHAREQHATRPSPDWLGLSLLALFMVTLIPGLQELRTVASAPLDAVVLLVAAACALALLIRVETRRAAPLVDFKLFAKPNFAFASALIFLLMFDIVTFLLYYNLFAQAPRGLNMSPIAAGFSLTPLSIALFGFARAAPWCGARLGLRPMLIGASLLLAVGCAVLWYAQAENAFALLMFGLLVVGVGIALPYASAPRIGLGALALTDAGKGSGMLNSCSFLGGTVGVTLGGIAFAAVGFPGVLALLGLSGVLAAALSTRLRAA